MRGARQEAAHGPMSCAAGSKLLSTTQPWALPGITDAEVAEWLLAEALGGREERGGERTDPSGRPDHTHPTRRKPVYFQTFPDLFLQLKGVECEHACHEHKFKR